MTSAGTTASDGAESKVPEQKGLGHRLAQTDRDCQIPEFGSSGRIRTYDQSVNPDCVGTLPLSYALTFGRCSRIRRADFQFLISRSRRMALARSGCCSDQTKVQGPFFLVNFPLILSVRL